MAEGFEYETKIRDGMSGPAHAQAEALGGLEGAISKTEKALEKLGLEHEHAGKHALETKGFFKEFTGSLIPEIAVGELAGEAVKKLGEEIVELGEKAVEFVKLSLEMSEFKENAVEAFDVIQDAKEHLFGPSEGEETYGAIEQAAIAAHARVEDAENLSRRLALSGVEDTATLTAAVRASAALQRDGMADGAAKLQELILRSEALGHLQIEKRGLAGLGVTLEQLAAAFHQTPAQIQKALTAGTIEAKTGIATLLDVINNGKVGQAAARKFDLTDVATDWHNIWRQLTEDVDSGPLTNALRDFIGIFEDGKPTARSFKDVVVESVNKIIRVSGNLVDEVTIGVLQMELAFLKLEYLFQPLLRDMKALEASWKVLGPTIQGTLDIMTGGLSAAPQLGFATGQAVGAPIGALADAKAKAALAGQDTGHSFVDGLAGALTLGASKAFAAGLNLGNAAHEGARTAIDAHSPSRKAFELGQDYGEGYARGGEASRARVASALSDMVSASPPPTTGASTGGSRVLNVTVAAGAIVIQGAEKDAHELAEMTLEQVADLINRINLELGG